ncbi:hypothetical protein [Streptomyces sp. NPDC059786]|uniref:hypothetical protein n=1 Tax=Streptomyces sp. NPDC059786 TaxID=3346946 RepID=UPI00366A47F5
MAHAAPASGTRRTTGSTDRTSRAPDTVLGPRVHAVARVAVPAVLGLLYGYWAAQMRRDAGPITGWNVLFGIVTGVVFMLVWMAVAAVAPRLARGAHAAMWGAFAGIAFGFLYSQGDSSVLRCSMTALLVGAGVFLAMFYRITAHEEAAETAAGDRTRARPTA